MLYWSEKKYRRVSGSILSMLCLPNSAKKKESMAGMLTVSHWWSAGMFSTMNWVKMRVMMSVKLLNMGNKPYWNIVLTTYIKFMYCCRGISATLQC